MAAIIIPYKPRYPQDLIHADMEAHRFVVLVAHRRMGKTVMVINHLIKQALLCKREQGVFAYVAPFRNQAKNIAWNYLKKFTLPVPGCQINEGDLSVGLPSGARVRLFGADNADALRGLYFDGVVLDEVAQMQPFVWEEVIRPAIADRQGFAVFIGTPKGINLFSELYEQATRNMNEGNKDWFAALYRADETGAIAEAELAFSPKINCFIGDNGMGKTTALEAMVVALGSYLLGVPKILSVGIQQDDFREEVEIIAGVSKQKTYYSPNILFDLNLGGKTYSGSRTRTDRSGKG